MANIWTKYGYTQSEWVKLDWKIKRKLLYKEGLGKWYSYYFPTFSWWIKSYLLWYRRPKGGYLLNAWFRHNAETFTINYNYPQTKDYLK